MLHLPSMSQMVGWGVGLSPSKKWVSNQVPLGDLSPSSS